MPFFLRSIGRGLNGSKLLFWHSSLRSEVEGNKKQLETSPQVTMKKIGNMGEMCCGLVNRSTPTNRVAKLERERRLPST